MSSPAPLALSPLIPNSRRVVQGGLLALLALITLDTLVGSLTEPPPGAPPGAEWVIDGFCLLLFALFAAALWHNTRPGAYLGEPRRTCLLLGLQLLLGVTLATDLLPLLAAQVPLTLPPRWAVRWMVVQALATITIALLLSESPGFILTPTLAHLPAPWAVGLTVLMMLGWQLGAFAVGTLAATEGHARAELARRHAELEATQTLLAGSSRLAERVAISRELHDTLGHHLTALSLQLELARRLAGEGRAVEPIGEAQAVTRQLLADVREVVGELRTARSVGLRDALAALARSAGPLEVHLNLPADLDEVDPARAHVVFRCVQEAITNTLRHAHARQLWIEITPPAAGLALTVRDDGQGAARLHPGHGLAGMRERLAAQGGELELETAPGRGFALHARWPSGPRAAEGGA